MFNFRKSRAFNGPVKIDGVTFYPGQADSTRRRFVGLNPYGRAIWCGPGAMYQGDFRDNGPRGARLWNRWDRDRRYLAAEWEKMEGADFIHPESADPYTDTDANLLALSTGVCISEMMTSVLRDRNGIRVSSRWFEGMPEWGNEDVDEYDPKWEGGEFITILAYELYGQRSTPPGWIRVASFRCGEYDCPHCGEGTGHESDRNDCDLCDSTGYIGESGDVHVTYWVPDGASIQD